jgi:serine/threonine-protein kinase HipA
MKMAMAVGDKRHYTVKTIAGRHFIQSAEKVGLGGKVARDVIDELINAGELALGSVLAQLPVGYPGAVAESIAQGVRTRLDQLGRNHNGQS